MNTLMSRFILVLIALTWFKPSPSLAQSAILNVHGLEGVQTTVSVFRDPTTKAAWRDVSSGNFNEQFEPLKQGLRIGHDEAAWWFRVSIDVPENLIGERTFLLMMPADLDDVRFYLPDGQEQVSGLSWPFSARKLPNLFPVLPIKLTSPHTEALIRVQNSGAMALHLSLLSEHDLRRHIQIYHFSFGFYYGILLLVCLMSLLNWRWTRDPLYGRYALLAILTAMTSLTVQGYTSGFILPEHPSWVTVLDNGLVSLLVGAAILFSLSLLQLETQYPRFSRIWRGAAWVLFGSSALSLTPFNRLGVDLALLAFLAYGICSTGISLMAWIKERSALTLLVFSGYLIFVIFQSITALTSLGLLPATPFTMNSWMIGNLILLILMLTASLYRTRSLQISHWEAEAALIKARTEMKEEQKRSEELRLFVGMLGHELGTPLAVIDSSLQCLEMTTTPQHSETEKWVENIRTATRRLDHLVKDSLARERVDSGGWSLRWTVFSASDLADAALSDYGLDLPTSGYARLPFCVGDAPGTLVIEISDPGLACRGDIFMLHRAIFSLLDNAAKYGKSGSDVRLVIEPKENDLSMMSISVINQGESIPEEILPRLFEKYYRYGDRTNVAGAGLGLYLVRQVAELHHGQAHASQLKGGLLRFSLDLPSHGDTQHA